MNWRSLLYVPADQRRYLEKAQMRGADALILDLEDSVTSERKQDARLLLAEMWDVLAQGPADLVVRINGALREAVRDIETCVRPGLSALYVAKTVSTGMLDWLSEAVAELEASRGMKPGAVRFVPLLETPEALETAFDIARFHRNVGLTLGSEDLATALSMEPTPENLRWARQRIVMAARSAGIAPLGLLASAADLSTENRLELVRRSQAFGFSGAAIVHPGLVATLNDGFSPSPADLDWARRVIAAMDAAGDADRGATRLDGTMLDRPTRERALAMLARGTATLSQK